MTAGKLVWAWTEIADGDASAAGRRAALEALATIGGDLALAYSGSRPIVRGRGDLAISISHGRRVAVAVIGRVACLGVDLCEHDRGPKIRALATRCCTAPERALAATDRDAAALWAAKEAGLKALGLGVLDGLIDRCPVEVGSLAPARYAAPGSLALQVEHRGELAVAVAFAQTPPSTTTVAPFM